MTEWTVLEHLRTMTSLAEDENAAVLPICRASLDTLKSRLRADADGDDPRLAEAAAAMALVRWAMRKSEEDEGLASFKAGDVTVTKSKSYSFDYAERIQREAMLAVLPLLKDESFLFLSV